MDINLDTNSSKLVDFFSENRSSQYLEKIVELLQEKYPGLSKDELILKREFPCTWGDSSLGCPEKDAFYLQVMTFGTKKVFECRGKEYTFHVSADGMYVVSPDL